MNQVGTGVGTASACLYESGRPQGIHFNSISVSVERPVEPRRTCCGKTEKEGDQMPERCAECGALLPEGRTCQEIFDEFTTLKYLNEDYLGVHFLLVSCFMIQHRRYSREALIQVESMLRAFLEGPMTVQQLRQVASQSMNGHTRTWKMKPAEDEQPLPRIAWRITIIDVAQNSQEGQDVEQYCAQVKQWARSILELMSSWHK